MTVVIRDAGPDDRPVLISFMSKLQDLEHALHPSRPPGAQVAAEHVTYLESECAAHQGRIILGEGPSGTPIALAIFMVEDFGGHYLHPDHQYVGWVSDLWIEPEHRGGDVLDTVLQEAETHFRALGLTRMMLSFLNGNMGARKSYEKRGFTAYETIMEREFV